jgi:3-isopropylmalate dehydrogenase
MLSAAMMLGVVGEPEAATKLRTAVLDTLAAGICTPDLGGSASTDGFTNEVCARLK